MNWIEIVAFVVVVGVLFPFLAYALGKMDMYFTLLKSGDIKFIMRGETLHKTICDIRGFELVNGKLEPTTEKQPHPWFGLYWIGFSPFASIHRFPISKERENPSGKTPEEWIERDPEEKRVSSLRFTFPRPYVLMNVELSDRIAVNVLVVAKFEVVNPYIPVFLFKGKFFENAGAILRASVIDILKRYDLDKFIVAEKGEVAGILAEMKIPDGPFNTELIRQVGLRLVGISIPQYDPSDKDVIAAMNAQTIAKEKAKALVAEATGHANQLKIRVNADALAAERMAKARGKRIHETVKAMASTLGSPDVVARGVADVLEMEAATSADSKLTTLVKGGGATPVVPVGGGKS